jgi:RsmE family RNA methyltransferase
LKKVLQSAAAMGVRRIMLIRASRVIKSYFSSPQLQPDKIEEQLQLGMEQGVSTFLPQVSVHDRFRPFVEDELPQLCRGINERLLAHPYAERDISELGLERRLGSDTPCVLAIGPEGGWQEHESEALVEAGFEGFSIGPRVLRVETALCALLGQIDLLRKISEK